MKIAFIATAYISQRDGVSVYIENVLSRLLEEVAAQRQPYCLSIDVYIAKGSAHLLKALVEDSLRILGDQGRIADSLNFQVSPYDGGLKYLWTSYMIRKSGPYRCVIVPNMQPLLLLPDPKLSVLHDLKHRVAPECCELWRYVYMELLIRYRLWCDAEMACISESTKADLARFFPGSAGKKIADLPNGLPSKLLTAARPSASDLNKKMGRNDLELLFVSRINRMKGFDRLLDVCSALDRHFARLGVETATVHAVGKQTQEASKLLASRTFRHVKLTVHGYLDDDALNRIYERSAFCLFLSRAEGFGLPLIEALWFGCIPILSDLSIFREVMGLEFPLFYGEESDHDQVVDFIIRVRTDARFKRETLKLMEQALERHHDGYRKSARNLLQWIEHANDESMADSAARRT